MQCRRFHRTLGQADSASQECKAQDSAGLQQVELSVLFAPAAIVKECSSGSLHSCKCFLPACSTSRMCLEPVEEQLNALSATDSQRGRLQ